MLSFITGLFGLRTLIMAGGIIIGVAGTLGTAYYQGYSACVSKAELANAIRRAEYAEKQLKDLRDLEELAERLAKEQQEQEDANDQVDQALKSVGGDPRCLTNEWLRNLERLK